MEPPTPPFTKDAAARRQDNRVLGALIDRNPNPMRLEHIRLALRGDLSDDEIAQALTRLEAEGSVRTKSFPNRQIPGRVIHIWELVDTTKYPVRETVTIGDVEFPRSFMGDMAGAEDLNAFVEALSEYNATVETRVKRLAEDLTRRYWANMAALLALFVAVFALIITGVQTVSTTPQGSTLDLLGRNAAALAPLAVVLFAFVFSLWLLLRRL